MTAQTKHFIEPGDVIAMRFDCAQCGASLSVSFAKEIRVEKLAACPQCNEPWIKRPNGASAEVAVRQCVDNLKTLGGMLAGGQYSGFSLKLEILPEAAKESN